MRTDAPRGICLVLERYVATVSPLVWSSWQQTVVYADRWVLPWETRPATSGGIRETLHFKAASVLQQNLLFSG